MKHPKLKCSGRIGSERRQHADRVTLVTDRLAIEDASEVGCQVFCHHVLFGRREGCCRQMCEESPGEVGEVGQPSLLQLTHLTDIGRNSRRAAEIGCPHVSQVP